MQPSSHVVSDLRSYTNAAPDDMFGGESFWSDEQLADRLVRRAKRVRLLPLVRVNYKDGGVEKYDTFTFPPVAPGYELEFADIRITDAVGVDLGVDFELHRYGEITFEADLDPQAVPHITYTLYDLYATAADVWTEKASHRETLVDTKAGNQSMKLSQEYQHCVDRAMYYRGKRPKSFKRTAGKGFRPMQLPRDFGLRRR